MYISDDLKERLDLGARAAGYEPLDLSEEEQARTQQYVERVAAMSFYRPTFGLINSSIEGRSLNREVVEKWNANRRIRQSTNFSPIVSRPGKRINIDDPWSMTDLLCIMAAFPRKAYAVRTFSQWNTVLPAKFSSYFGCDITLSGRCTGRGTTTMPLKVGEFITIHKMCSACTRWFFAHDAELVEEYRDELCGDQSIEPTNELRLRELLPLPVKPNLRSVHL